MILAGFDIETSGLLAPEHRIVEIALLLYDYEKRQKLAQYVRRFNPGRPIDAKATEVHGILFEHVAHLPQLQDSPQEIETIIKIFNKADVVVAHNGDDFDIPFMRQELQRVGKHMPEVRTVDTMKQGKWATDIGKNPRLEELCFACRVPYDRALAHAAQYDVERMMDCFFHAERNGFFELPISAFNKEPAWA